ncbi:MAG: phenylalanine--tRNA ligase subunit beta [Planctomycetes bacterium]|nr:phenylalanine--tRNA ligase subunit beta [Planctomycetota bacterium]
MKISYHWLKDYCNHTLSVKALSEGLTNAGLVVDTSTPVGDDFCLDVEVTSNRPDCLGIMGIAREVAVAVRGKLLVPDVEYPSISENIENETCVENDETELCPRYTARLIKGTTVGPSPVWLQKRIQVLGLRPVNNIVDITNYVLMESGQPLHAFDFDKLEGKKIVVRRASHGETMEAIDGTRCIFNARELVIADSKKPVAIAGVMGGKGTEVTETTKNVFLESAFFEPRNVRRVSRKLGIRSDSSFRFERHVDPECVDWASRRAAKMIQEIAGGQILEGVIDLNCIQPKDSTVTLRTSRLNSLLGIHIDTDEMRGILERLCFTILSEEDNVFRVSVPSFRGDVYREVDLIEEIARIHGYGHIPATSSIGVKLNPENRRDTVVEKVKHTLSGSGYNEVVTDSIVDRTQDTHTGLWSESESLRILNPIRHDEDRLRKTIIFNLLKVKKHNQNYGTETIRIYELSRIYLEKEKGVLPDERECISILCEEGYLPLKGMIEAILHKLNINHVLISHPFESDLFNPQKSAALKLGGETFGYIGELSKALIDNYDFKSAPCVTELDFELLVKMANLENTYHKTSSFPTIVRDLAVIADEAIAWAEIRGCIISLEMEYLKDIIFFDMYRGKQIGQGKKSIAFRLIFRADDRTLRSDEVDAWQENILKTLEDGLKITLRS